MNADDLTDIADETHSGTVDGTQVFFRAYLDEEGRERLIWKIDDASGNNARLDFKKSTIILPQGRELYLNGERARYLTVPRWLAEALQHDFDEFPDHLKTDKPEPSVVQNDGDDDEEIKPIFDDIPVDERSSKDESDN